MADAARRRSPGARWGTACLPVLEQLRHQVRQQEPPSPRPFRHPHPGTMTAAAHPVGPGRTRRRRAAVAVALAGVLPGGVALQQPRGPGGEPAPSPVGVAAASTAAAQGTSLARIALAGDVGTGDDPERRTARAVDERDGADAWDALVLAADLAAEHARAGRRSLGGRLDAPPDALGRPARFLARRARGPRSAVPDLRRAAGGRRARPRPRLRADS